MKLIFIFVVFLFCNVININGQPTTISKIGSLRLTPDAHLVQSLIVTGNSTSSLDINYCGGVQGKCYFELTYGNPLTTAYVDIVFHSFNLSSTPTGTYIAQIRFGTASKDYQFLLITNPGSSQQFVLSDYNYYPRPSPPQTSYLASWGYVATLTANLTRISTPNTLYGFWVDSTGKHISPLYQVGGSTANGIYMAFTPIRATATALKFGYFGTWTQVSAQSSFDIISFAYTFDPNKYWGDSYPTQYTLSTNSTPSMISFKRGQVIDQDLIYYFPSWGYQRFGPNGLGLSYDGTRFSVQLSNYFPTSGLKFTYDYANTYTISITSGLQDTVKPELKEITIALVGGRRYELSISVIDPGPGSGFYKANFTVGDSNLVITSNDLVSGNVANGIYKVTFDFIPNNKTQILGQVSLSIWDFALNQMNYTTYDTYWNTQNNPILFPYFTPRNFNITSITSNITVLDSTYFTNSISVPVRFEIKTNIVDTAMIPILLIDTQPFGQNQKFYGKWDVNLASYTIDFKLFKYEFSMELPFRILFETISYSNTLLSTLPKSSILSINSPQGDKVGPILVGLEGSYNFTQPNYDVYSDSVGFATWKMRFNDSLCGFKRATVYVNNTPRIGLKYTITASNLISGTKIDGIYQLDVPIPRSYINLTISCIETEDFCENQLLCDGTTPSALSMFYFDENPNIIYGSRRIIVPALPDQTFANSPIISYLNYTLDDSNPSYCLANFTVTFNDDVALSNIFNPHLYLQGLYFDYVDVPLSYKLSDTLKQKTYFVSYKIQQTLGYLYNPILINIYGINNKAINQTGYHADKLRTSNLPYYIGTGCTYPSDLVPTQAPSPTPNVTETPTPTLTPTQTPTPTPNVTVTPSPNVTVTPKPTETTTTPPLKQCPGTPSCGGNGDCYKGDCICNGANSGPSCEDEVSVPYNPPSFKPEQPEVSIVTSSFLNGNISVYSFQEIGPDSDTPIREILFQTWTKENPIDSQASSLFYRYTHNEDKDKIKIVTDIQYFTKKTIIEFANDNITLSPYSIKFTVKISNYTFSSPLNYGRLVLKSSVNTPTQECSSSTIGYANKETNDIHWMKINIGLESLYSRFVKRAVIDNGRVIQVENQLLNPDFDEVKSGVDQVSTFIGIKMTQFQSITIDPDFSVLLDNTEGKKECSPSKSKIGMIAGIVVGCAVAVGIAVGATLYTIRRRYANKESLRIKKRLDTANHNK